MIGYLDMDVPVGPKLSATTTSGPEPIKSTMNAPQDFSKMFNGPGPRPAAKPRARPRSAPSHDSPGLRVPVLFLLACARQFRRTASDDLGIPRHSRPPYAPLEYLVGNGRARAYPKTKRRAIPRLGRKALLGLDLYQGKAGRHFVYDRRRQNPRFRQDDVRPDEKSIARGKQPGARRRLAFEGKLDSSGKQLVLERLGNEGPRRLSRRNADLASPNANYFRYTMTQDRKSPARLCSPNHRSRRGERGRGVRGGSNHDRTPEVHCDGWAGHDVRHVRRQPFPLCCSGCLGEFNDNPEKYVKKAAQMLAGQAGKPKSAAAPARVRGRRRRFRRDVRSQVESPARPPRRRKTNRPDRKMAKADATNRTTHAKAKNKPPPKKDTPKPVAAKAAARAATLVRLGRSLERAGKTDQALPTTAKSSRTCATTPSAKTAAERIKELEEGLK